MSRLWFLILSSSVLILYYAASTACAQLASEVAAKSAEESMSEYLLMADELSVSFCARLRGDSLLKYKDLSKGKVIQEIFAITARAPAGEYYSCYGSLSLTSPRFGLHPIPWREELWDGTQLFRKMSAGEMKMAPLNVTKELKKDEPPPYSVPILDPFGLALSSVSGITAGARIQKMIEHYLNAELVKSAILDNGNVVGRWVSPNRLAVAEIQFGADCGFMPITVSHSYWNNSSQTMRDKFSDLSTTWRRNGKVWLPTSMKFSTTRKSGDELTVSFSEIDFVDPDRWSSAKIDFATLAERNDTLWRDSFLVLFDSASQLEPADRK